MVGPRSRRPSAWGGLFAAAPVAVTVAGVSRRRSQGSRRQRVMFPVERRGVGRAPVWPSAVLIGWFSVLVGRMAGGRWTRRRFGTEFEQGFGFGPVVGVVAAVVTFVVMFGAILVGEWWAARRAAARAARPRGGLRRRRWWR